MRKCWLAFGTLLLAGAAPAASASPSPAASPAATAQWGSFGDDFASMDRKVHPGDDFWSYVNRHWARTIEIPADRGALSQVQRLNDLSSTQVRAIPDEMSTRRASLRGDDLRTVDYTNRRWTRPRSTPAAPLPSSEI